MDLISIYVASILFCFFANNYSLKYKEEKIIKKHDFSSLIFSCLGQIMFVYGYLLHHLFFLAIGMSICLFILSFQLYVSIRKINDFDKNKGDKTTIECIVLSIRNVFMVIGAPLICIQKIVELIFEFTLYNN